MARFDDIRQLLERFHLFYHELEKSRNEQTQRLKTRLDAFWPAFLEARKTQARLDRDSAPAFNVFRLLDLERAETVHTQFLADLLNPSGTHGQGVLFLEHFLSTIRRDDLKALLPSRAGQVWVTAEFRLDSGKRPDIALSCPHQFFVVIENKIGSDASEGQLQNYRDWLDRFPALDEARRVLVFLTVQWSRGPGKFRWPVFAPVLPARSTAVAHKLPAADQCALRRNSVSAVPTDG